MCSKRRGLCCGWRGLGGRQEKGGARNKTTKGRKRKKDREACTVEGRAASPTSTPGPSPLRERKEDTLVLVRFTMRWGDVSHPSPLVLDLPLPVYHLTAWENGFCPVERRKVNVKFPAVSLLCRHNRFSTRTPPYLKPYHAFMIPGRALFSLLVLSPTCNPDIS